MLYVINYDLRKRRDYPALYQALSAFNAVRVLESTWCFHRINTSAQGLVNYFSQFVDADDGLYVTAVVDQGTKKPINLPLAVRAA